MYNQDVNRIENKQTEQTAVSVGFIASLCFNLCFKTTRICVEMANCWPNFCDIVFTAGQSHYYADSLKKCVELVCYCCGNTLCPDGNWHSSVMTYDIC